MKVVAEEEEEEEKKTLVVGVKLDSQSKELLTWSLVKLAMPGDLVVALHVLPPSNDSPVLDAKAPNLLSLVKSFDSMLAVYEGFCNLKQIDLKLKICRGSSTQKTLVQEAHGFNAAILVLGVAKRSKAFGLSSVSIAKHCAKKVARNCSVLAVTNGKIIFQREAKEMNKTRNHAREKNSYINSESSSSNGIEAEMISNSFRCSSHSSSETESKSGSSCGSIVVDDSTLSQSTTQIENCSICQPDSIGKKPPCSKEEEPLVEERPHWHLLQKVVLDDKRTASQDRPRCTMFQWAMRLSNRYSMDSATVSGDKLNNSKASLTSTTDSEIRSIVSMETDTCHSLDTHDPKVRELPKELESLQEKYARVCRLFSYKELMQATSDFSPGKLIGKGGSSRVYKGCLSEGGKDLAVKILKQSANAMREFVSEIEIISALNHKNIISLHGFCFENENLILVYDFLSKGSLEEILHGEQEKIAPSWVDRYKVAIGVAEALDHLHSGGSAQPVIHGDVKSSNILLCENFEPKLSDFGLAKWANSSTSNIICEDVAGTFGYLAPEYLMYGKVDEKIDVYAFGVILLELLSGRKPVNTGRPKGQESLVMWAKSIIHGGQMKLLVDPCLGDEYDSDQMEKMALAASLCIRRAPEHRPRIAVVLKLLQGDSDTAEWARSEARASERLDGLDDEAAPRDLDIRSHINLALLDIEDDDSLSVSSTECNIDFISTSGSLDEYLQGRCSRSSSFD